MTYNVENKKHILIIEDEPFLAEMYEMKMKREGYRVSVAFNGDDGVMMAHNDMPDLILLDLIIPGLNGREVLKKLKGNNKTKRIKIVVLSNLNQDEEVKRCFDYGADGFLVKANMTPRQVCDHIAKIFAGKAKKIAAKPAGRSNKDESAAIMAKCVLIIEDQLDILEMYRLRLEKEGYEVESARDGARGLKMAQEKSYAAIVLDSTVLGANGFAILKSLKADPFVGTIPVIVLANSITEEETETAKKIGAAGYFSKSDITPSDLAEEINKAL